LLIFGTNQQFATHKFAGVCSDEKVSAALTIVCTFRAGCQANAALLDKTPLNTGHSLGINLASSFRTRRAVRRSNTIRKECRTIQASDQESQSCRSYLSVPFIGNPELRLVCIAFRHHASWVAGFSRNPFIVLDHIGIVLNASIQPTNTSTL
jgi:hypothetical protein